MNEQSQKVRASLVCIYVSDINECMRGSDGCDQYCRNLNGTFECFCGFGYYLHSDGKTCLGKLLKGTLYVL